MQERELSQKDEKSFKEYFAKLVEENSVVPALWLMQDEFNEFFLPHAKGRRTLTTAKERNESRIVARVARNNNARRTCTMGLVISPVLGILRGYLVFKAISEKKLREIKRRCWLMLCLLSASNLVHHLAQRLAPEAPCVSVLDFGTPI